MVSNRVIHGSRKGARNEINMNEIPDTRALLEPIGGREMDVLRAYGVCTNYQIRSIRILWAVAGHDEGRKGLDKSP